MSTDPRLCTTSGESPDKVRAEQTNPTGQHKAYIILCDEEREKGFVRPVRDAYQHVGTPAPRFPLRDLTDDERAMFADDTDPYVKFEPWPEDYRPSSTGRYWTQAQLDAVGKGCGTVTTMGRTLAETYARDPHFYGATFCCGCNRHLPVGENGEFVWLDGSRVGA